MFDPYQTVTLTIAQIEEALGEANAYFFFVTHGRSHYGVRELIRYYIENLSPRLHPYVVEDDQPLFV